MNVYPIMQHSENTIIKSSRFLNEATKTTSSRFFREATNTVSSRFFREATGCYKCLYRKVIPILLYSNLRLYIHIYTLCKYSQHGLPFATPLQNQSGVMPFFFSNEARVRKSKLIHRLYRSVVFFCLSRNHPLFILSIKRFRATSFRRFHLDVGLFRGLLINTYIGVPRREKTGMTRVEV